MAKGFKHGSGGSSVTTSLNFKVVGGTSSPSNASENTIWVNTDEAITSWVISPVEPVSPEEGMVWIESGSSGVSFNALKKNGIMLYPLSAKQYVDGAWANKAALVNQDGKWSNFSSEALYLYMQGDVFESVTGGYVTAGLSETGSNSNVAAPAVTYGESAMVILPVKNSDMTIYTGGIIRTSNKIDCSQYSKLIFEGNVEGVGSGTARLCAWSEIGTSQSANREIGALLANGSDPVEVDVSDLDGSYYIGFGFDSRHVQTTVTVDSLRLE